VTECNVILAGVGGQGVLLFAEILGEVAVKQGYNVHVSEIHGMAQRGGAVVSDVRIGEKAVSPTVLEGTADVIVGLEPVEALRSIKFANDKTLVLVNTAVVKPSGVSQGASYPSLESLLEKMRLFTRNIIEIDATGIAKSLGNANVLNVVMLGALAATGKFPVESEIIRNSIKDSVSERFVEINLKAFDAGYNKILSGR
jgi:indolepyruvate ferredoxin oxidoreductase beta subunit